MRKPYMQPGIAGSIHDLRKQAEKELHESEPDSMFVYNGYGYTQYYSVPQLGCSRSNRISSSAGIRIIISVQMLVKTAGEFHHNVKDSFTWSVVNKEENFLMGTMG